MCVSSVMYINTRFWVDRLNEDRLFLASYNDHDFFEIKKKQASCSVVGRRVAHVLRAFVHKFFLASESVTSFFFVKFIHKRPNKTKKKKKKSETKTTQISIKYCNDCVVVAVRCVCCKQLFGNRVPCVEYLKKNKS